MRSELSPISVITTSNGSAVACRNTNEVRWRTGSSPLYTSNAGSPRTRSISARNMGTRSIVEVDPSKESRSKFTPLTMKNTGMRKPKPMASSRGVSASDCSGLSASRAIMPAANAPSRLSRPRSAATTTSATISRMMMRTGNWVEVDRWRWSISTSLGGWGRDASAATPTARPAKMINRTASTPALWALSSSVTARIGPNSPTAPAAVRKCPKRVSSMPRSRSIGSSVPMAVVVSASPTSRPESTTPSRARTTATTRPTTNEISQPPTPRLMGAPRSFWKLIS